MADCHNLKFFWQNMFAAFSSIISAVPLLLTSIGLEMMDSKSSEVASLAFLLVYGFEDFVLGEIEESTIQAFAFSEFSFWKQSVVSILCTY